MCTTEENLKSVSEALNEMVQAYPCKTPENKSCHCKTCESNHVLSYTGLYNPKEDSND